MEEHVLSLKRNLYVNSGCHIEAERISLYITSFAAWSLYMDTAVIKLGAVLHSVMSGYCCHQVGCIAIFCHVRILLSSCWVHSYFLSCVDTAVVKLGALLFSAMSGYCCRHVGCSATFCHVWILLSSSWVQCNTLLPSMDTDVLMVFSNPGPNGTT